MFYTIPLQIQNGGRLVHVSNTRMATKQNDDKSIRGIKKIKIGSKYYKRRNDDEDDDDDSIFNTRAHGLPREKRKYMLFQVMPLWLTYIIIII